MIIIGDNLSGLIKSLNICNLDLFDEFSISLKMDKQVFRIVPTDNQVIKYGVTKVDDLYKQEELVDEDLLLKPNECVLACSADEIRMPHGYMGFVQTKGTLARHFVSAHCSDSHIEPGYKGKITLELTNHSPVHIKIPVNSIIAQLFICRCSTTTNNPYLGKYLKADKPTIPLPF